MLRLDLKLLIKYNTFKVLIMLTSNNGKYLHFFVVLTFIEAIKFTYVEERWTTFYSQSLKTSFLLLQVYRGKSGIMQLLCGNPRKNFIFNFPNTKLF